MDNGFRSENIRIYQVNEEAGREMMRERAGKMAWRNGMAIKEIRGRERGRSGEKMLGRIERKMEKGKDIRKLGA